jgi:hypothetical protein
MGLFDNLPDDPELAFLLLEERFRNERLETIEQYDPSRSTTEDDLRYFSRTLAARTELGLKILENWELPNAFDYSDDLYKNFIGEVDHFRTIFEIRNSRRNKGLTVRFDATAKAKLRHHTSQLRDFVSRLEIDDWKRDDIYSAINALDLEIDRDRSRLGVVGQFFVTCGSILGETADKAEPARKWLDSISRLIWGAEMQERTEHLPAPDRRREIPAPPRQIEPPKELSRKVRRSKLDDEIPF